VFSPVWSIHTEHKGKYKPVESFQQVLELSNQKCYNVTNFVKLAKVVLSLNTISDFFKSELKLELKRCRDTRVA